MTRPVVCWTFAIIIAGLAQAAPQNLPWEKEAHPQQQWNYHYPPPPQQQYFLQKESKCDGKKNLIDDLGIVTFIISIFSTFIGFGLDLVLSLTVIKTIKGKLLIINFSFLFF
jgi:hypothetical protein